MTQPAYSGLLPKFDGARGRWTCGYCGDKMWHQLYGHVKCYNYACDSSVLFDVRKGNPVSTQPDQKKPGVYSAMVANADATRKIESSCNYCNNRDGACLTAETALHCDVRTQQLAAKIFPNLAPQPAETLSKILDERGSRYGSFATNAAISQQLFTVVENENNLRIARQLDRLKPHQLEALKQICAKISRILSGDADYEDNWIDIAGYAQLGNNPR